MAKGILGPTIVTICLGCIGSFHIIKNRKKSEYLDANKSVGELLQQQNYSPISFGDNQTWDEIIAAYQTGDEGFGKINGSQEEQRKVIKEKCKEIIEKQTNSIATYNNAMRWCVKPQSTKDRLKLEGRVEFQFNENEKDTVIQIAKNYKNEKISDFDLSGKSQDNELFEEMKKGCEALLKTKNHNKNFESALDKVRKLCSIKKT